MKADLLNRIEKELTTYTGRRLVARRLDVFACLKDAIDYAKKQGRIEARAYHGGCVANAYGYPADTEALVVIAAPNGRATAEAARIAANKVTESGVAARCYGEWARPYFDNRFGDSARSEAYRKLCAQLSEASGNDAL